jgi:hypothetical protein
MQGDGNAAAITLRDEQSAQRLARKLLHRLSQSLAFALLCEAASAAMINGDPLPAHSAWRYFEEIEPPAFGAEDDAARLGVLELLQEDSMLSAKNR